MNASFGYYLRIKPQDNMLILLFAKAHEGSLIQSIYNCIKIFLWATFALYYIKYAILDRFWAVFSKYYPLDSQECLKTSC